MLEWTEGVFCSNFSWKFGAGTACNNAWCGSCYISPNDIQFPSAHLSEDLYQGATARDKTRLEQAWKHKHRRKTDYQVARNGDHLLTPFECDFCVFKKLKHRFPSSENAQDQLLMSCIRRSSLDAFWSRATATVGANRSLVKQQISLSQTLGLEGPFTDYGPSPSEDHCGREVAAAILLKSRWTTGKNSKSHLQFNTVRRLRSSYSNYIRASTLSSQSNLSIVDNKGRYSHINKDPCGSLWFGRFMVGLSHRMGQISFPNLGMSTELLKEFFLRIETNIATANSVEEKHNWIVMTTYCALSYVISLRGNEGFLLDLKSCIDNWDNHSSQHIVIGLLGRYKGENQDYLHLIPCVNKTKSGLNIRNMLHRIIRLKQGIGFQDGPLISDRQGMLWSSTTIDEMMSEVLKEIFVNNKSLFDVRIKDLKGIEDNYKSYRTFRRSSDTRAMNMNVSSVDIDVINRWSTVEKSKGKKTGLSMKHHYAELNILLGPFTRYTTEM